MKWIIVFLFPLFCFSQNDSYNQILKLPKKEFDLEVIKKIDSLESLDLLNFLLFLEEDNNISLNQYHKALLAKAEKAKWPNEILSLTKILIEQGTDKEILKKILITKKNIWDEGQWSQKFWNLIKQNNFSIAEDSFYKIDQSGQITYNIASYITEKTKSNEMGNNPLLMIDYKIADYPLNELLAALEKLDIKDIRLTAKDKSIALYGSKGADGMLQVITKK